MRTVLLIGPPNSGKSSLFNLLSGATRKVSNYSGITVDTGIGQLRKSDGNSEEVKIIDLPGIYTLHPESLDEAITTATLLGVNKGIEKFDEVVVVLDLARLESSLALTLALKEVLGDKLVAVVNKRDLIAKNQEVDWGELKKILGVQIHLTSAHQDSSEDLDKFIRENLAQDHISLKKPICLSQKALDLIPFPLEEKSPYVLRDHDHIYSDVEFYHRKAREILEKVRLRIDESKVSKTLFADRILLHPFFGGIIFLVIFYMLFHAIYAWADPLMTLVENGVLALGNILASNLPDGFIKSLLVDGIVAGVGGVVVFLPQIMILFLLISLMEQSGYISRAAFLSDRILSVFGLNGKAFLPYLSGFACAVPAIMATRTISDKRERMATLMTIPLVTCSARLPVYVLLVGTFIPSFTIWGILNSQALAFFFLYFLGTIVALIMAKVFRLSFFRGQSQSFFMDMPLYQIPSLKVAFKTAFRKGKVFLKKAGTIILGLSIVIWFASNFPKPNDELMLGKSEEQVASIVLENSLIGKLGKVIEPVISPLGYDWKIGVGVLVAFGARELFVSALGTIYALGDVDEESSSLRERLANEKNPQTGAPVFNMAVAWSLLIFFAFACQCMSTLAIVRRETDGWLWPGVMFGYMTILAYSGAFIVYQILV